ncbi:MAG: FecR family protein [Elusimicrobiota bacterium]
MKKILSVLISVLFLSADISGLYAEAKIDSISGDVTVNTIAALVGQQLNINDVIKTAAESNSVIMINDHKVTVSEKTEITISELTEETSLVEILVGKLRAVVKELKAKQKFEIKTPTAICAVRGTEFMVEVFADGKTVIEVYEGLVGARNIQGIGDEVAIYGNQKTEVLLNQAPSRPESIIREAPAEKVKIDKSEIKKEVGLLMTKEQVQSAAAEELRLAEYQEGKTLIDVYGKRIRLEEYIMRPAKDQFKLVVLNDREDRFDYFYYKGEFNKDLPDDLSVALKDMNGKLGDTAPDYYLTEYEKVFSNTQDSAKDTATGGHLVKITYNIDGTFTLTDSVSATNTKTVNAADTTNGAYEPVSDTFDTTKTTALDLATYNTENDKFETFSAGQTFWKTRFNTYEHTINDIKKQFYLRTDTTKNVLVADLDGNWIYPAKDPTGKTVYGEWGVAKTDSSYPDGDIFHNRIRITYLDDTFEQYDSYIISDDGKIANFSDFNNITTGTDYKKELLKWNYQQVLTATEFGERKIDLVVEPKIFIKSGLIR